MQTEKRAIRLAVQEVLINKGYGEDVELEIMLSAAIADALADHGQRILAKERDRDKARIVKAIARGEARDADVQALWHSAFHTHPNWSTKTNKEFLDFLKSRPKSETLPDFAEWWFRNDWRGKEGQPPTPAQCMESWELSHSRIQSQRLLFDV